MTTDEIQVKFECLKCGGRSWNFPMTTRTIDCQMQVMQV